MFVARRPVVYTTENRNSIFSNLNMHICILIHSTISIQMYVRIYYIFDNIFDYNLHLTGLVAGVMDGRCSYPMFFLSTLVVSLYALVVQYLSRPFYNFMSTSLHHATQTRPTPRSGPTDSGIPPNKGCCSLLKEQGTCR